MGYSLFFFKWSILLTRFNGVIYLFIFGCVVYSLLHAGFLQLCQVGVTLLRCAGFSLRWLLLLRSTGSRHTGFSSCGTQAQQLWRMGLVALQHVASSWTRDRTRVPCMGRQILNHCATSEVHGIFFSTLCYGVLFCSDLFSLTTFKICIYLFIFGHAVQLEGSQFPDQGSNLCPRQ